MQQFLNWLIDDLNFYGLHFQNWMVLTAAIFVTLVVVAWQDLAPRRK